MPAPRRRRAARRVYLQFTCQPLSFDFTLAAAYPFYSHPAFDPIKAYDREQLKAVFRDPSFRDRFRENLRNPIPGTIFQGNWDRVIVAVPVKPENAGLANRTIGDIARKTGRDPLDLFLDLGLDENLDTGFIGRFLNAVDEGVEPLVKHKAGVIALSDAGAHIVYLCDAGFGLYEATSARSSLPLTSGKFDFATKRLRERPPRRQAARDGGASAKERNNRPRLEASRDLLVVRFGVRNLRHRVLRPLQVASAKLGCAEVCSEVKYNL